MTTRSLPELPVSAVLPALGEALAKQNNAVLVAPPGAGKTTLVPLALLEAPWLGAGKIILLEPRRLAARAAARRMAELLGEEPGATVGYAMRMENRTSARTKILVVTEGVLARMILDDPELPGVSAVIFDEFHERSLDGDFGLALALDVQGALRPDLRVLVMSATLDGARVAKLLSGASVIESQGRAFPVDVRYDERPAGVPIEDAMAKAIRSALADESGSVLAFLPGQREIERTAERLQGRLGAETDIVPLYGQLDNRAQDAAIKPAPPGRRKVVLATSIAETSITIDGVRVVIDSGLSRVPRYEPASGLTRLETVRFPGPPPTSAPAAPAARSQASPSGCGAPSRRRHFPPSRRPRSLKPICPACCSIARPSASLIPRACPSSIRRPRRRSTRRGRCSRALHAIDAAGRLTEAGGAMRKLALPVRLAHMVAEAAGTGHAREAAMLAVLLTERGLGGDGADLERRLMRFRTEKSPRAVAARQLAERLATATSPEGTGRRETERGGGAFGRARPPHPVSGCAALDPPLKGEGAGLLLIHAWPDRVAKARGERGRFVLANGSGAMVDAADPLAGESWLVVADLQGKAQNARITAAAAVDEADIRAALSDRIETRRETSFDRERRAVRVRETARLGAITCPSACCPRRLALTPTAPSSTPCANTACRCWHGARTERRCASASAGCIAASARPGPTFRTQPLSNTSTTGCCRSSPARRPSPRSIRARCRAGLMSLVPHDLQRKIGTLAPTHFDAPSGSHVPIRYDGEWPVLAIRVQELFGLDRHPAIANGTVPLTLELLSPAHRPIQTTRDLPGFWRGSWADVRTDMRGRYPAPCLAGKPAARRRDGKSEAERHLGLAKPAAA